MLGSAPADGPGPNRVVSTSEIAVADQRRSVIDPECPDRFCALAWLKVTVPKSARGAIWQLEAVQSDGASAIHSAEPVSTRGAVSVRANAVPRVRSAIRRRTRCPLTVTLAEMRSPGRTVIRIVRDGAGTSSSQAIDRSRPLVVQSASVPICSSARELALSPPMPTQNAENVGTPGVHETFGWTQEPLTCRNDVPARDTAYPAQFALKVERVAARAAAGAASASSAPARSGGARRRKAGMARTVDPIVKRKFRAT